MIGKLSALNPFKKHIISEDMPKILSDVSQKIRQQMAGVTLPEPLQKDTAAFTTPGTAKKGIKTTIKGFFSNIREKVAKKAAQAAEAQRTQKALDSDFGKHLKQMTYERDWGSSSYGGSSIERLYSDKSITAICEMKETNPRKAMSLMETLRADRPGLKFSDAIKIQEKDPEIFAVLSKVGKINEGQFATLASVKHIDPNTAEGLSNLSIKTLDAIAGKSQDSLDAVNKIMQDKTLRTVLTQDIHPAELNYFVTNMVENPDLTTRFSAMLKYEMQDYTRSAGTIKKVNDLIDTYKIKPGVMGAYIDGYKITDPAILKTLYKQDQQGLPVMHLLEESSHCTPLADLNQAKYVSFRTDETNKKLLQNMLTQAKASDKANGMRNIMETMDKTDRKVITRMAEDGRKPQTVKEFNKLVEIYSKYPEDQISSEFIDYYTKHRDLASFMDLMKAFKS